MPRALAQVIFLICGYFSGVNSHPAKSLISSFVNSDAWLNAASTSPTSHTLLHLEHQPLEILTHAAYPLLYTPKLSSAPKQHRIHGHGMVERIQYPPCVVSLLQRGAYPWCTYVEPSYICWCH